MRNLKALGLALVAAFAMSAVVASAASAAEFRAESTPVTLTGAQEGQDVFETDAGEVECTEATYHGTQSVSPAASVEVAPTYSGCSALFGTPAEVIPNGCKYRFKITSETSATTSHGTVDIVCPVGKEITVTVKGTFGSSTHKCTVHIPSQNGIAGITYTSEGTKSGRYVMVDVNANTIKYSQTAGTGLGACSNASNTTNGIYIGQSKVTGEVDGGSGAIGVWVG